jgi:hypothetical protein
MTDSHASLLNGLPADGLISVVARRMASMTVRYYFDIHNEGHAA